jgi:hypothetical protein
MKRTTLLLAALMAAMLALPAMAGDGHDHGDQSKVKAASAEKSEMKAEAKTANVTGEVIDTGCYMAHGATGEKHASCATKCIAGGMPMGLLTDAGTLYLITMNHDNPDAYNKLKEMAAKKVVVTGVTHERSGMKAIDAIAFKPAEPAKEMKQ